MTIGHASLIIIDFLRLPRPQGELRKSIYTPAPFASLKLRESEEGE
jgi:hypothetical protein